MIAFLIKSALSLAVLLAVYHLALQRENMHHFKRFYLLFAICFSFVIPFIQIEAKQEALIFPELETFTAAPLIVEQFQKNVPSKHLTPLIFWGVYLSVALMMLVRFTRNIFQLFSVIKNNVVKPLGNARLVLLDHAITPHSFLHYVFFSKKDYDIIEQELLQHELTHIKQKHSLDILLIEVLTIIFWFNPLIYLYRKAIKLNHEFLADEAAIRVQNDVPAYQQILLSKIFMNKASGPASHVHYSLTKKRLLMMTKSTSLIRMLVLKLAALPLFTGIAILLCVKTMAQQPPPPSPEKKFSYQARVTDKDSLRELTARYYSNKPGLVYTFRYKNGETVTKGWKDMTPEEREHMPPPPPMPVLRVPSQQQLDEWLDSKKFGISFDGRDLPNEQLRNYKPEDFGGYLVGTLDKDAKNYGKYYFQVFLTSRATFDADLKKYKKMVGME